MHGVMIHVSYHDWINSIEKWVLNDIRRKRQFRESKLKVLRSAYLLYQRRLVIGFEIQYKESPLIRVGFTLADSFWEFVPPHSDPKELAKLTESPLYRVFVSNTPWFIGDLHQYGLNEVVIDKLHSKYIHSVYHRIKEFHELLEEGEQDVHFTSHTNLVPTGAAIVFTSKSKAFTHSFYWYVGKEYVSILTEKQCSNGV